MSEKSRQPGRRDRKQEPAGPSTLLAHGEWHRPARRRTVARFADDWNAPYLAPAERTRKNEVLDRWCSEVGRDGNKIARTINVGFYMGADAKGAARGEELYQREWAADTRGFTGFLRGTPSQATETVKQFREAGAERLNIAVRGAPYDWDALAAFAEQVIPAVR